MSIASESPHFVIGTPAWSLNGVCVFAQHLARGLLSRGASAEILVTRAPHRETKPLPVPADLPLTRLPVSPHEPWRATWLRLAAYLARRRSVVYLPNHDVFSSPASVFLPRDVVVIGVAHSDDPQHYAHAERMARHWDLIGGVSARVADELRRRLPEHRARILRLPYGVSLGHGRVPRAAAKPGCLRMVYAGRLVEGQKRTAILPEIVERLVAADVDARLSIIGGGTSHLALARCVAERRLDDRIRFHGVLSPDATRALVAEHDVYVLPSGFEGLPLGLLEAMADGVVPVVSAVESGIPELVRDGVEGSVVADTSAAHFAERLAALAREPGALAAMSARAPLAVVAAGLTLDAMVDRYLDAASVAREAAARGAFRRARAVPRLPPELRRARSRTLRALLPRRRGGLARPGIDRPLRVAAFVSRFPSLSQTFVASQLTGLLSLGHDVTIFPLRAGDRVDAEAVHQPDVDAYGLLGRVRAPPRLAATRGERVLHAGHAALTHALREPGSLSRAAAVARRWPVAEAVLRSLALEGLEPFDVVHAHFGPTGEIVARLVGHRALARARSFTSFYGHDVTAYTAKHGHDVYRGLFHGHATNLALSDHMRAQLLELGASPERTAVHRLGIDTACFTFAPRALERDAELEILSTARLVEKKGIDDALRALARLERRWTYTVIGDGPLRAELERLALALGIAQRVRFVGAQPQDVVRRALGRAHVLLAASRRAANGDEEGTPVAVLEAMASGVLVVSTRHSAIPELITDGVTGFLAEPGDASSLEAQLRRALASSDAWPRMREAARDFVATHHDARRLARDLERLYLGPVA